MLDYKQAYENIEKDMKLTDMDLVMPLVEEEDAAPFLTGMNGWGLSKQSPRCGMYLISGEQTDPPLFS